MDFGKIFMRQGILRAIPRLGNGSVGGPSVLMEGVRGQHEHHNKQNNDKEENKGWLAILLLPLLQPYTDTCAELQKWGFT